jgi:hypothetical protein
MLLLMLPENQSLGTDLRYSSVRLITPILGDHFRFVGNSSLIRFRESAPSHVQAVDRCPILRQPNFQLPVYLFLVGEAAEGLRKTLAKS